MKLYVFLCQGQEQMLEIANLFLSDQCMEKSNNVVCYLEASWRPSFSVAVGERKCENVQTKGSTGTSQCSCDPQCSKAFFQKKTRGGKDFLFLFLL